ncbi:hypothetical protein ACKAV7_011870 [Fusarium commune]
MRNSLERDWGKSFIIAVEVSLELASVYESQKLNVYKAEKLYEGLWSFCLREKLMNTNPGNNKWKFNPSTMIHLQNKLYKVYGRQRASIKFCRVAREYRQMCLKSYGDGHREHIVATLRNDEILDRWQKPKEAEKIYAELLETCTRQSGLYEEADMEIRLKIGISWVWSGRAKYAVSLFEKMFEDDDSNNISSMLDLTTEIASLLIKGYKKEKAGMNRSEAVFSRIMDGTLSISDRNDRSTRLKSVFQFYKKLVEGDLLEARKDVLEAIWSNMKSHVGLYKDDYVWFMKRAPRLKFAEDIRNAALDQPSAQPSTKKQLEALERLPKSHPSQCMVELWEKWHMVCATGEATRKLAPIAADSFSYSDKAGSLEAARILQQTWDRLHPGLWRD